MAAPGKKLEELVEAHYPSLYRYAYRLTGKGSEAEDLTQETFCQAHTKLAQLRDWDRARYWLFAILRNLYLHRLRAEKKENALSLESCADLPERVQEPLPEIDPQRLQEALNELPESFRSAVILYYFEDFSYRDIAEQMDLPIGTVMSRLARAKAHLRATLLTPATVYVAPAEEDR
jgi:RNA polymerase sigma-70 factor (ECF subfamily)